MRSACPAWFPPFLVVWLLTGCASVLAERTAFRATDDLVTTTPRYLVEAGHSELVSPPAGVRFALELQVVRETPARGTPSQRYEAADVQGCELVDDEGITLRPAQIFRKTPAATNEQAVVTTTHQLIFDLPLSYRPQRIATVTVHWALVAPSRPPVKISSRFQR
ncbi:MAG: hypothetical protein ACYTGO_19830 [Planctomycetota bacterium]|jgi:hypothetical protein